VRLEALTYHRRIALVSVALVIVTAVLVATAPRPGEVTVTEAAPVGSEVALNAVVRIAFSRPVDRASAEASFRIVPIVAGSFSWRDETLVFVPREPLAPATNYNVTIRGGLRDERGRPNRSETRWTFRTR
jgi:hypothetical protein